MSKLFERKKSSLLKDGETVFEHGKKIAVNAGKGIKPEVKKAEPIKEEVKPIEQPKVDKKPTKKKLNIFGK